MVVPKRVNTGKRSGRRRIAERVDLLFEYTFPRRPRVSPKRMSEGLIYNERRTNIAPELTRNRVFKKYY